MAETITDIKVYTDSWTDISSASGITAGTKYDIQNKKGLWVDLYESATEPDIDETSGKLLSTFPDATSTATIPTGSLNIWAKARANGSVTTATLNVQEL